MAPSRWRTASSRTMARRGAPEGRWRGWPWWRRYLRERCGGEWRRGRERLCELRRRQRRRRARRCDRQHGHADRDGRHLQQQLRRCGRGRAGRQWRQRRFGRFGGSGSFVSAGSGAVAALAARAASSSAQGGAIAKHGHADRDGRGVHRQSRGGGRGGRGRYGRSCPAMAAGQVNFPVALGGSGGSGFPGGIGGAGGGDGGAIFSSVGLTVSASTFSQNSAAGGAGEARRRQRTGGMVASARGSRAAAVTPSRPARAVMVVTPPAGRSVARRGYCVIGMTNSTFSRTARWPGTPGTPDARQRWQRRFLSQRSGRRRRRCAGSNPDPGGIGSAGRGGSVLRGRRPAPGVGVARDRQHLRKQQRGGWHGGNGAFGGKAVARLRPRCDPTRTATVQQWRYWRGRGHR